MYGSGSGMKGMKKPPPKYPHKMYKGNMVKTAKTPAEHARLEKLGYNHTKPRSMK